MSKTVPRVWYDVRSKSGAHAPDSGEVSFRTVCPAREGFGCQAREKSAYRRPENSAYLRALRRPYRA